jgi:hypothetical protein
MEGFTMDRRKFLQLMAATPLALSGCETAEMIETSGDMAAAREDAATSVVFGRVLWIENGTERTLDQSIFGWSLSPRLLRLEDRRYMNGTFDPGGRFRWSLPPGTYVIDRINYRDPMTGNYFIVPKVAFQIPAAGQIYYVGTLRADATTDRGFLGVSGATDFSIIDNYRSEARNFQTLVGAPPSQVTKRLMKQDDSLPDSIDNSAEAQVAITLLGAFF